MAWNFSHSVSPASIPVLQWAVIVEANSSNDCGTAEYNQFCHPVQRYAATPCNGMLRLSATLCCHLMCKVSSTPKACGAAVAVRSGRCPVRAQESKVRFADDSEITLPCGYLGVYRYRLKRGAD